MAAEKAFAALKAGRALGQEAKGYMERGALVPDNLVMRIVRERLEAGSPDDRYLFDGFCFIIYHRNTVYIFVFCIPIVHRVLHRINDN